MMCEKEFGRLFRHSIWYSVKSSVWYSSVKSLNSFIKTPRQEVLDSL